MYGADNKNDLHFRIVRSEVRKRSWIFEFWIKIKLFYQAICKLRKRISEYKRKVKIRIDVIFVMIIFFYNELIDIHIINI